MARKTPSYKGRKPASNKASAAARGSSRKRDTKPEVLLRKALWGEGLRYRKNVSTLPGKPDIVFPGPRVVVFCDGDFWHGKDWESRRPKLARGTNAPYWVRKIERNMERDGEHRAQLQANGWTVLRYWESDIKSDRLKKIVSEVRRAVRRKRRSRSRGL